MDDTEEYAGSDLNYLGSGLRMMCEDRILVTTRDGRSDELHAVLRQVFGEDAEPEIAELFGLWTCGDGESECASLHQMARSTAS